jgi:hypothetical protein
MTTTASIAELQRAGVTLEAGEAVAVTQQLIHALRTCSPPTLEPPYGPPTAETVVLGADGTVSCTGCGATPAISEVAIFLEALLPPGSPRVPGGLRYTIARALLEVDVAPFDSLDAFSAALVRYERGDRGEIVRRLVQRSESACAVAAFMQADRRRPRATATELRRALREADACLYAHHASARVASPRSVASPAVVSGRPAMRNASAIAACLGAGMMLVAAGEFMQRSEAPKPAAAPASVAAPALLPAALINPPAPTLLVGTLPAPPPATASSRIDLPRSAPQVRGTSRDRTDRSSSTRAARAAAKIKKTGAQRPGVLDRLKLQWLRKVFVIREDKL